MDRQKVMQLVFGAMTQLAYEKTSNFFLDSSKYLRYRDEMNGRQISLGIVNSLSLECSGQSSFNPRALAARFINHLAQILRLNNQIKSVKLKISGFDLIEPLDVDSETRAQIPNKKDSLTLIKALYELLKPKMGIISTLQIRICNVKNCSVDDFKNIMYLGVNTDAKELTNLTFQFGDWSFPTFPADPIGEAILKQHIKTMKKANHDRNGQPPITQFMTLLDQSFENTMGNPIHSVKRFRLEISTWYYTDFEMERFFYNAIPQKTLEQIPKSDKLSQRIQYFHNQFKKRVQTLIFNLMPELLHMELDLRNWSKKFEMDVLKSGILNISNQQKTNSMSQISKRVVQPKNILSAILPKGQKQRPASSRRDTLNTVDKKDQKYFDLIVVI